MGHQNQNNDHNLHKDDSQWLGDEKIFFVGRDYFAALLSEIKIFPFFFII